MHCSSALHCTALQFSTALHCTALQFSTVLHCTALHRVALRCTALYCMMIYILQYMLCYIGLLFCNVMLRYVTNIMLFFASLRYVILHYDVM